MRATFLIIFILVLSVSTFARNIRLFENGIPVAEYNDSINKLSHGERYQQKTFLLFDDQPPIEVIRFLGHGGLTAVFQRADGRALRVPLASGNAFFKTGPNGELKDHGPYTEAMSGYYEAMKLLTGVDDLIPKVYEKDTHLPQYITVEFFDAKFNISDFFNKRDQLLKQGRLIQKQIPELENSLRQFIQRFSIYKVIGDFKTNQIMTDGKSWKLLDLSTPARYATEIEDPSPFDHRNLGPRLPPQVWESIKKIVREYRKSCEGLLRTAV